MSRKPPRRRYSRPIGTRRKKVLFLISVEGALTECQYFNMFNSECAAIQTQLIHKKNKSAPKHVLGELKKKLKSSNLHRDDEAWVVIDRDQWSCEQINAISEWAEEKPNYYFALSNPNFEYWPLLHFEDVGGKKTAKACKEALKKHIADYNKKIPRNMFTEERIAKAIERAEKQIKPNRQDWPRRTGTTVYRLVRNIREAEAKFS